MLRTLAACSLVAWLSACTFISVSESDNTSVSIERESELKTIQNNSSIDNEKENKLLKWGK